MSSSDSEPDRIIKRLRQLFDEVDRLKRDRAGLVAQAAAAIDRYDLAILMVRAREDRGKHFDGEVFGEPGWDILLDLYVAYCRGVAVSTSSACIAARVAPTTGLRWIGKLVGLGLVERTEDQHDARRVFCHISERGLRAVEDYLDAYAKWVANSYRPRPNAGGANGLLG